MEISLLLPHQGIYMCCKMWSISGNHTILGFCLDSMNLLREKSTDQIPGVDLF